MASKLVILDRDGVINFDSAQFIKSPAEWKPIPGSLESIARLNHSGFRVVVATNQSGVGRGLFDMDTLNAIHAKMHRALLGVGGRVDAIFFCPHTADTACSCRKPRSGLFEQIAERFNQPLTGVPAIGDSLRDLQAGVGLGVAPMLVLTGKGGLTRDQGGLPEGTQIFSDLSAAVEKIIAGQRHSNPSVSKS